MNREIKFRYIKDNKEIYYALYDLYKSENWTDEQDYNWFISKMWDAKGFSNIEKSQFTGLKDKNSKEIWEGDVVRWRDQANATWTMEVIWYEKTAAFTTQSKDGFRSSLYGRLSIVEVIGNIYENPELLSN